MSFLNEIERTIATALRGDRPRLTNRLRSIERLAEQAKPYNQSLDRLLAELNQSVESRRVRTERRTQLKLEYDPALPICGRRDEIAAAIRERQVVVVCGETGSGKSTQLPKILLDLGYGLDGYIGHTQPRRIAARSIANRLAQELGSSGGEVAYKVRFGDQTRPETMVKLMTDGILLAETQSDRSLEQYDCLILDEAHERSLNIDFLLGYLRRLQARRPDLKIIITSATIDAQRFAAHFGDEHGPAPVVEVSGRTYPVETRYHGVPPDANTGDPDPIGGVCEALDEIATMGSGDMGSGDVLVFLPTERDIREAHKRLRGRLGTADAGGGPIDILPLYARLSIAEQNKVFQSHPGRRIVLATNVAESSLTVPNIRFVVDTGTARVSRYSTKSKVQRLPIEAISQASANQRQGRCGRVGPGVCYRIYDEDDFAGREPFTQPEILRTNLASVILQTLSLQLGEIEHFPFLDPPRPDAIRDGYKTLFELGAIDEQKQLTPVGKRLASFPCDPRIARMIVEAQKEGCLRDVLVIASALEVQDVRERPPEREQAADAAHAKFFDADSDFLSWLKIWEFLHDLKSDLSRNQFERACRQNFLNVQRIREWQEVHRQLLEMIDPGALRSSKPTSVTAYSYRQTINLGKPSNTKDNAKAVAAAPTGKGFAEQTAARQRAENQARAKGPPRPGANAPELPHHPLYGSIHRSLLAGLLANIAMRGDGHEYKGAGGLAFFLWPGSNVFEAKPQWIVAAELVETTRRYLRMVANVDPAWIEPLASHLVKKHHHDPYWNSRSASPMCNEKVTLFGLPLVNFRRVPYGPIDPKAARKIFIEHALVQGDYEAPGQYRDHNRRVIADALELGAKLRERDFVLDSARQYDFFDARVPVDVWDGHRFERWRREIEAKEPRKLWMRTEDVIDPPEEQPSTDEFPDELQTEGLRLKLAYRYEPGSDDDGVTLNVPVEGLSQLFPEQIGWLVPGLLAQRIEALIRTLPKTLRVNLVPAPDVSRQVVNELAFGKTAFMPAVASALSKIAREPIAPSDFDESKLPGFLRMNVRVIGPDGKVLGQSRDLFDLKRTLGVKTDAVVAGKAAAKWQRQGLTRWDFGELPASVDIERAGLVVTTYPTLVDEGKSVSLKLYDNPALSQTTLRAGLRRLVMFAVEKEIRAQLAWLPDKPKLERLAKRLSHKATLEDFMADLMTDRALFPDESRIADSIPRSADTFSVTIKLVKRELPAAVAEATRLASAILEKYDEALTAISSLRGQQFAKAIDDMRRQLQRLMPEGFWTATPWNWLSQFPRYLQAIIKRCDKLLSGGVQRDLVQVAELLPQYERLAARQKQHAELRILDPELEMFRWMLEEWRVSLFAQELGTQMPVSAQRVEKQWAKVRIG